MENNILIEQMTSKDIDGVFEVEKNCFEHHWSKDAFKKELSLSQIIAMAAGESCWICWYMVCNG